MLRVNSSERFGLKFGSKVSPAPVGTSLTPGNHGWGRFWVGRGSGATQEPLAGQSTPTRKVLLGLPPQPPVKRFGPPQVSGCSKPGVSIGTRSGLTPLMRPKIRAKPPRITVLGNTFQAAPTRGLISPKYAS